MRIVKNRILVATTAFGLAAALLSVALPADGTTKAVQAATVRAGAVDVDGQPAPYGAEFPVTQEPNFARPVGKESTRGYGDFTQLDDLERLIRGSYIDQRTGALKPVSERYAASVFAVNSRMEDSVRVGRELVKAAQAGVKVRFIHPRLDQSPASKRLMKQLNAKGLRDSHFKLCGKKRGWACLSSQRAALMHSKVILVSNTFTRADKPALGAVWTGSANFGGRSAERTFNNGNIIYNDKKFYQQMLTYYADLWTKRNVGNDYPRYIKKRSGSYGYPGAAADGYLSDGARYGVFYSNLSHFSLWATPIPASPSNGRDPILNMLNRIVPDSTCRIRLQENRFKYRRIGVAYKLAELANEGCSISAVAFKDDRPKNWNEHCFQQLRICKPILDVFKTADTKIYTGMARPHDKTILVEAKFRRNPLNPEEVAPAGQTWSTWPASGIQMTMVQAGSAALTGSNLIQSDEVTTESTDPDVFEEYLEHWQALLGSREYSPVSY